MTSNSRLNLPRRRLLTLLILCIGALASILAMSSQALAASGSNPFEESGPLVPQIINGQEATIAGFPWQVFVAVFVPEEGKTFSCGGSILNSEHILTAAHCVDHEGSTTSYPAEDVFVIAGASNVQLGASLAESSASPATAEARAVSSFRTDPLYGAEAGHVKDDVAVLTLKKSFELTPAKNMSAIGLVAPLATPPAGTSLSISGYGREEGAESSQPNGKLYSTNLVALSSDACRNDVAGNSAVLLCAASPNSATCQGDSGGPLTEGTPAVQVGLVDFGPAGCPVGQADVFTNVAAPEIRDFIEGIEPIPVAARPSAAPVIKATAATPLTFSPATCEPGTWTGSPTFSYTFQLENGSGQVAQSGASNVFLPPPSIVGVPLVCIVQATNPGGVSTLRSATTAPVAADTTPPVSSITGLPKCHLQACTLQISASDPNLVAFSVSSTASYLVAVKCPSKKKKKHHGKSPSKTCHKTETLPVTVTNPAAGSYQASVSRLPYGEKITFSVLASNAAGIKQPNAALTAVTLHKPKPKPKKKPKKKKKKG